jgi:hypothetical protein
MLSSFGIKPSSLDLLERSQLPPAQARAILQVMEAELAERDRALATKADLESGLRGVEHRLELRIESLRGELRTEIAGAESRLVRWNFAFWVAQLAAVAALLKLVR